MTPLSNFEYPTDYFWDFGDGTTYVDNIDGGGIALHAYAANGLKKVTLRVVDPNGSMQVSKVINVGGVPQPPTGNNLPCGLSISVTGTSTLTMDYEDESQLPTSADISFINGTGNKVCFNPMPFYFWTIKMEDCYAYNKFILKDEPSGTSSTLPLGLLSQNWRNLTNNDRPWGCVTFKGSVKEVNDKDAANCCSTTKSCLAYIKPSELEVSELEVSGSCSSYQVSATVSGGGWKKYSANGPLNYQTYEWSVYNLKNPDQKIEGILSDVPGQPKTKQNINLNSDYFKNFAYDENFEFLVKLIVTDWANQKVETNQLVSFNPLRATLKPAMTRCPNVTSLFSENPIGSGGTEPYTYLWSTGNTTSNFTSPGIGGMGTYTVTVTDAQGCTATSTTKVTVVDLNLSDFPNTMGACTSSATVIGPTSTNFGGSGSYDYAWTAFSNPNTLSYFSATNVANPVLTNLPTSDFAYVFTVTDRLGGCSAWHYTIVKGYLNTLGVDIIAPASICYGEPAELHPITSIGFSEQATVTWTTTNYHVQNNILNVPVPTSMDELKLSELDNSYPGIYKYKARLTSLLSGCFKEREISINHLKDWTHTGYVPQTSTYVAGAAPAPLWKGANNTINNFNTTPATPSNAVSVTWTTANPATVVLNPNTQIPKNGTFVPTAAAPYLTMHLKNTVNGCAKDFVTNKYLVLSEKPEFWISSDKKVYCTAISDLKCFYIEFDAHVGGVMTSLLPSEIDVKYGISGLMSLGGVIKLKLTNSGGLYKGQVCIQHAAPNSGSYNLYVELVNSAKTLFGINTALYSVPVVNSNYASAIAQCKIFIAGTNNYAKSIDIGLCDGANGEMITNNQNNTAKDYIEIHPNASLAISCDNNNIYGIKFYINQCGSPQLAQGAEDALGNNTGPSIQNTALDRSNFVGEDDISLFPNPFTDEINIQCQIQEEEPVDFSINLYDYSGKYIKTLETRSKASPGRYDLQYDLSDLPSGVYLYGLEVKGRANIVKKSVKI